MDPGMIEARDEVSTQLDVNASSRIGDDRRRDVNNSQDGLYFLANETGGKFYRDQNYLDAPIRQALSIETGYYLLAYEPDDESFKSKGFNKIEVKLKRPGLRVTSRSGFLPFVTESQPGRKRSENSDLLRDPCPLRSPASTFPTAFFANRAGRNYVSFLYLNCYEIHSRHANGLKSGLRCRRRYS